MSNLKNAAALVVFIFLAAIVAVQPVTAGAAKTITTEPNHVAIKGYDPVAYFTKGQPMKGKPEVTYSWNGAQWHFANAGHRDMFAGNPERYAPQFGGHCSMALALDRIKVADPEAWMIVDGKLYLNFSKPVQEKFRQNTRENIEKAEVNWNKRRK